MNKVSSGIVRDYFSRPKVIDHYEDAANRVGLWNSEKIVFTKTFPAKNLKILELGCGAGRIAFGLNKLGYSNLLATDFSREMIKRAIRMRKSSQKEIIFSVEDALSLSFPEASFDGIIFGFNGLMQIPGREKRKQVMKEAYRVLRKNGYFVFTTHDRTMQKWKKFWVSEKKRWKKGEQNQELLEFGDRFEETDKGMLYIHVPEVADVRLDLSNAGFSVERDLLKSKICEESKLVHKYSDDCRFWIARRK